MLKNYFKIALRNILRHKGYSFINIFGLAIGLASCFLILLWVQDECSYDRFHAHAERLYRVEQEQNYSGSWYHVNVTPYPCGPVWRDEIPEIEDMSRYAWCGGRAFRYAENSFFENEVRAVDPAFFTMFDYELVLGNRNTALDDPYSVVITEETAKKYFGDENPIGKVLMVDNQFALTVSAVMKAMPHNSILSAEILLHFDMTKELGDYNDSWGSNSINTFILLGENADPAVVDQKLTEIVHAHREESDTQFMAHALPHIHLYGFFGFDHEPEGIIYVYIFSIIAAFVLLIACINFMNLATARSANRAREIGMRKVIGARRKNLVLQFLGESFLLTVIAALISLLIVFLLLPAFNTIAGKEIQAIALLKGQFLLGLMGIALITGMLSGSYPALFLSSFQPVKVLKGNLSRGQSQLLRRILVIVQFVLSVVLIIGTLVVYKQLQFMRSKDLGFDQEHVISISLRGDIKNSYEMLQQSIVQLPEVLGVSASSHRPTNIGSNSGGIDWDGKDPEQKLVVGMSSVDFDYIETMDIQMLEGRAFSREFPGDVLSDDDGSFIINRKLAEIMNKESVIGQELRFVGVNAPIVGVMNDFHFRSVHNDIEPLALFIYPPFFNHMLIRLSPGDIQKSLAAVREVWQEEMPNYPFEYRFLDEDFEWMYRSDKAMSQLVSYFAILAIIIACLGLFGLASFTAEQRSKEIGIRKVLGASVPKLIGLMTSQFTRWVLFANLIAFPLAYLVMRSYLQKYAYRIPLNWSLFVVAGVLALVIALLTVSYQAIRAATANPAKTIRYE